MILALKYRPKTKTIGQNFVSETIFNSIKSGKVPNAYLLQELGCWKTTIARIVANL